MALPELAAAPPALHALDRATIGSQRVSDTWMLLEGTRVD
jgi:hypothetical protein